MSFAATAAAAITAGSAIYMGAQQRKRSRAIRENAQDPGIQPNPAIARVSNMLLENYNNYNLPGYSRYVEQIRGNQAFAVSQGMQAATSSGDALDVAARGQFMADSALNELTMQNASGREAALMRYLSASQSQGQDQVRMNMLQLGRYDRTLNEAAALEQAGTQNMYQGFQDAGIGISALANSFMPRTTINPNTGEVMELPSIWQSYRTMRNNRRNG